MIHNISETIYLNYPFQLIKLLKIPIASDVCRYINELTHQIL